MPTPVITFSRRTFVGGLSAVLVSAWAASPTSALAATPAAEPATRIHQTLLGVL